MKKIMWEVNYHSTGEFDRFSHCTVTKIVVIRDGVLDGCTGSSITAIGTNGREFLGSIENYFETEAAAWESAKVNIEDSIKSCEHQVAELQNDIARMKTYLGSLK